MSWLINLPVQVQAATIGAAVAIFGVLLKDGIFRLLHEHREARRSEMKIFRKYADPLANAAASLLWRLNEIFTQKGRSIYLSEPVTEFEKYKHVSTAYRIAAILGWIRAFRRELSFLEVRSKRRLEEFKRSVRAIEKALADGPHVELQLLTGLSRIWKIQLPADESTRTTLAINVARCLKVELHSCNAQVVEQLAPERQSELCLQAARLLHEELALGDLDLELIAATTGEAIQRMAIREAWLYRDWQAAIGDLMIEKADYGGRAFDVIGFGNFERIWYDEDDESRIWIDRLNQIFKDLSFSDGETLDARVQQLRNTMVAVAQLVVALTEIQPRRGLHLKNTVARAKQIIESEVSTQHNQNCYRDTRRASASGRMPRPG